MARSKLLQNLSNLSKRIDLLLSQQKRLKEKVEWLEKENQNLISRHAEDALEIERLKKELDFLTVSYHLASSPDDLIAARNKISKLIRNVDSCIRMIIED